MSSPADSSSLQDPTQWLATAHLVRRLIFNLSSLFDPTSLDGVRYNALRHQSDPDTRCDLCPRDCTWFRAEGDQHDCEELMLCYSCFHQADRRHLFRPTRAVHIYSSFTKEQLAQASATADHVVMRAPYLHDPIPDLVVASPRPVGPRGPDDEPVERVLSRFGTLAPSEEGGTPEAVLACRAHIRAGVALVVAGPRDGLEDWRWSRDPAARGACWTPGERGGTEREGALRVGIGAKRTKILGVSLETAYDRIMSGEVVQLIDWPGDIDLQLRDVLPSAMGSYHSMVPDVEMMHMERGAYNLDADLYPIEKRGVTGPFLYSGGSGTYTALHLVRRPSRPRPPSRARTDPFPVQDSSSALNVAVTTLLEDGIDFDSARAVAVWVIIDRADADKAAACLAQRAVVIEDKKVVQSPLDTMYTQHRQLDARDLYDLADAGVTLRYIPQRLGDRVIIPAGCPHFVKNLVPCVKVAADFIAPCEVDAAMDVEEQRAAYYAEDPAARIHADISRIPANAISAMARVRFS
ncbi:hypothetical protein JCM9279_005781 [Rhodotorula babjevae]